MGATVFVAAIAASWFLVPGQIPLADFAARWSAGRLVLDGQGASLYDLRLQADIQRLATHSSQTSWFVSPPFVSVIFLPLALLPYTLACGVWFLMSAGCLALSLNLLRPLAPAVLACRWSLTMVVACTSYPVLQVLFVGQDTTVVLLAAVIAIRLLSSRRQALSGAVLALTLVKPHLAFLLPLVLVSQKSYRALLGFGVTAAGLACLSLLITGSRGLQAWAGVLLSRDYASSVQQGYAWKSVSVSALMTGLAPTGLGWMPFLTAGVGLSACLPTVGRLFTSRGGPPLLGWSLALATTIVASPHVLVYDLVIALPAVLTLAATGWDPVLRITLVGTILALWIAAPLQLLLDGSAWPVSAIGAPWAVLGLLVLWRRLLTTSVPPPARPVGVIGS